MTALETLYRDLTQVAVLTLLLWAFYVFGSYLLHRCKPKEVTHTPLQVHVGIKQLPHAAALPLPTYAHNSDSGFDLYAASDGVIWVPPQGATLIPTGLTFQIPPGFEIQIRPRSGMAATKAMVSAWGTIDQGYTGEVKVILFNHGATSMPIQRGDKVAQGVLAPVVQAQWTPIDTLDVTDRGGNGFGSTGR